MKYYAAKKEACPEQWVLAEDMLLTADLPTAAGSKMLEHYMSLFEEEVITRLNQAGYPVAAKAQVGEFAIDLLGETCFEGPFVKEGKLASPAAEALLTDGPKAVIGLDVNGHLRRAAAQNGLVSIKPTYGTVSRFGTIPAACSGETVSIMAKTAKDCKEMLSIISGHDDKDGTSLSEEVCKQALSAENKIQKVALPSSMLEGLDEEVKAAIAAFKTKLEEAGVLIWEIGDEILPAARVAWNILMSAEVCNNVSRYDGIKYGYRTQNFKNLDELYVNSRTEAFGELLKTAILFGSECLSSENYDKVYDKALRIRRVIANWFTETFGSFDAVLLPACSTFAYGEEAVKPGCDLAFTENRFTAPASVTGLPAMVVNGVQLVGPALSEGSLLALAEAL